MNRHILIISVSFSFGVFCTFITHTYLYKKSYSPKHTPTTHTKLEHSAPQENTYASNIKNNENTNSITSKSELIIGNKKNDTLAFIKHIKQAFPDLHARVVSKQNSALLLSLFLELTGTNPQAAAELFDQYADSLPHLEMLNSLMKAWNQHDPLSAFNWLLTQKNVIIKASFEHHLYESLLELGRIYPETADNHLHLLQSPHEQQDVLAAIAQGWMKQGSAKAFAWLDRLEQKDIPKEILGLNYINIMTLYAEESPYDAALIIDTTDDKDLRDQLSHAIIAGMASENIEDALEWIQKFEDPVQQVSGLYQLTVDSRIEASVILEIISASPSLLESDTENTLLMALTEKNIALAPRFMLERIERFPKTLQPNIISTAASYWFESDRESALSWLNTLSSGSTYDAAASQFSYALLDTDADTALSLARSINAPEQRLSIYEAIISSVDREALGHIRNQIDLSYFSAEEQENLLSQMNNKQSTSNFIYP